MPIPWATKDLVTGLRGPSLASCSLGDEFCSLAKFTSGRVHGGTRHAGLDCIFVPLLFPSSLVLPLRNMPLIFWGPPQPREGLEEAWGQTWARQPPVNSATNTSGRSSSSSGVVSVFLGFSCAAAAPEEGCESPAASQAAIGGTGDTAEGSFRSVASAGSARRPPPPSDLSVGDPSEGPDRHPACGLVVACWFPGTPACSSATGCEGGSLPKDPVPIEV